MKAWGIWSYQPLGWPEAHPAVIVSGSGRVANKPELNVLMCSSKQATREAMPNEVILDSSDGLNWFCEWVSIGRGQFCPNGH